MLLFIYLIMIHYFTKNIDQKKYNDIIQRIIMINGNDGTNNSGYKAWIVCISSVIISLVLISVFAFLHEGL